MHASMPCIYRTHTWVVAAIAMSCEALCCLSRCCLPPAIEKTQGPHSPFHAVAPSSTSARADHPDSSRDREADRARVMEAANSVMHIVVRGQLQDIAHAVWNRHHRGANGSTKSERGGKHESGTARGHGNEIHKGGHDGRERNRDGSEKVSRMSDAEIACFVKYL